MIPLTPQEIARAAGGTVHGTTGAGAAVTGPVVTDSREVTAGSLFAAIAGARSDGHDFADAAYAAGAIRTLAAIAAGRRTIAVLGEMMHQADGTIGYHREIGALAGQHGIRMLIAVGDGDGPDALAAAARTVGVTVHAVPDGDAATSLARELLAPGDIILVKASSMIGLSAVAAALGHPAG